MSLISAGSTIGILGGGQLGKMTAIAASQLGYHTHIFCPAHDSPAFHVSRDFTKAEYDDEEALKAFVKNVDVVTAEFENVPFSALEVIAPFVPVRPGSDILKLAQNRVREKELAKQLGIPTASYVPVHSLEAAIKEIGTPCVLKTTELGYDGKGQILIDDEAECQGLIIQSPSILEEFISYRCEVSSLVARGIDGSTIAFPTVENVHENGILRTTYAPARIEKSICEKAQEMTLGIAEHLDLIGLLTVEYFVTDDGDLLFNEMAPRPHNSGHWTLDGCVTSQFEQLVRAICGLPFGSTHVHTPTVMHNLIGDEVQHLDEALRNPNAKIHLYGKEKIAPGRKMGHINQLEALSGSKLRK